MNENSEQIPSKAEMKEALLILLPKNCWTKTHDDILEEYRKVKEKIKEEEIKDGETIKKTKKKFKSMYEFFSNLFENMKEEDIIGYAIEIITVEIVNKAEIVTIYNEKRYDLQKEPKYCNVDELKNNNHNSYMVTVAIIFDIYVNGSNYL